MSLTSEEENLDIQEQETDAAGKGSDNLDDLFGEDDDGDPYIEPEEEEEDDVVPGKSSSAEGDSDFQSNEDLEAELKLMQRKMQKLQQQLEASQKTRQPENKPVQRQTSTKSLTPPQGVSKSPPPTRRHGNGSPLSDVTAKLKNKHSTARQPKAAPFEKPTPVGQSMNNCQSQPISDSAKVNSTLKSPPPLKTPPSVRQAMPRSSVSQEVAVEKFSGLRLRSVGLNPRVNMSLFLFGSVHTDLWKTDTGTVIGILNPNPMKNKDGSNELCLTVDHPQKVLIVGEAMDFGTCKAKKKKGDSCTQLVNLYECQYCQYHVKAQYKKMSSKRSELQSSFTVLLHVVLNSGEVSGCSGDFKGLMSMPTPGALNIKKHLGQAKNTAVAGSSVQSISASDLLKQQKEQHQERMLARKKRAEEIQKRVLQSSAPSQPNVSRVPLLSPKAASEVPKGSPGFTSRLSGPPVPTLGRGFSEGDDILLDPSQPQRYCFGKLAAVKKLQAKGSVMVKDDPNAVKHKRANSDDIADRVERNLSTPKVSNENSTGEEEEPVQKKRREQLEYIQSEEFQRILNAKSPNSWMMGEIEERAMQEYFEPLVQKEQMEEKMKSIREMKCRAITCKTCKYAHFKPADRCVEGKHDYHWHDACGQRKICLARMPHGACSHCGLFKIGGELLLPRGEEQPKFLNSLK
uniref:Protein MCM10 homolog n=1 Tax=Cyprinus carpio TaxID=7962 RepID=A0A8C2HGM4_CYPCA